MYQKTVKSLFEDPASLWYDNLEQMKKDYSDMKEVYDIINAIQPGTNAAAEEEEKKAGMP